jgi:hypothetical protein
MFGEFGPGAVVIALTTWEIQNLLWLAAHLTVALAQAIYGQVITIINKDSGSDNNLKFFSKNKQVVRLCVYTRESSLPRVPVCGHGGTFKTGLVDRARVMLTLDNMSIFAHISKPKWEICPNNNRGIPV